MQLDGGSCFGWPNYGMQSCPNINNDPAKSLAQLGALSSVQECLQQIPDPELQASLAQVPPSPSAATLVPRTKLRRLSSRRTRRY